MSSELPTVQVGFTPELKRNLRALSRKYRHVRSDVQPVIEQIQRGEFVGDRIQGMQHVILKVRIRNSDIPKGKSAGYRLIYTIQSTTQAVLVTIYSKSEQGDISPEQIRRILLEYEVHAGVAP